MEPENNTRRTTIDLDSILSIPLHQVHQVNERLLCFFPNLPNWIVIDSSARDILEDLQNSTVGEAIHLHGEQSVVALLRDLLERRILGHSVRTSETKKKLPIHLYLTNACNLICPHCYMSSGLPLSSELGFNDWKAILTGFASYGGREVSLSGGEPLLCPFLPDLLTFIRSLDHSLRIKLLSNGTLLQHFADAGRANLDLIDEIQISLDGPTARSNDAIRGSGTFSRVLSNIELLRDYRGQVTVSMCVLDGQVDAYEKHFTEFYQHLMRIIPKVKIGLATDLLEGRKYRKLDYTQARANLTRIRTLFRDAVQHLDLDGDEEKSFERNSRVISCGYGGTLTIRADGMAFPCGIVNHTECAIGNVKVEQIEVLIQRCEDTLRQYQVSELEECNSCDLRYACGGTCRIENKVREGVLTKPTCCAEAKLDLWHALYDDDLCFTTASVSEGSC